MAQSPESPITAWLTKVISTKRGAVITFIVAFVIIVVLSTLFVMSTRSGHHNEGAAAPSSPGSGGAAAPAPPGGSQSGSTRSTSETAPAPETPSPTTPPTPLKGQDDPGAPGYIKGTRPPWTPSSKRKPLPSDTAKDKKALLAVVPKWATFNTAQDTTAAQWMDSWEDSQYVQSDFLNASQDGFVDLWGGAIQSDVSASHAKVVSAKMLWNVGSDALWRVTVKRDVIGNSASDMNGSEKVTWDFQMRHEDGLFVLEDFMPPAKRNESPKTYQPPQR